MTPSLQLGGGAMSEVIAWKFIGIYIRLLAVVIQKFYTHILFVIFVIDSLHFFIMFDIKAHSVHIFY